ncbi:peptidase C60 family protein [Streptomyces sp. 150FB]|uniref:class E sortase n=1 Tax=Streptomyces sp. 150FB TaxID=1576605 RepID=UPI00058969C3|nr:class E sortase [Streptomyces sp. 150FB]KIF75546.1 peptidase C60 family protein [Streptomyces sp. 150FB]
MTALRPENEAGYGGPYEDAEAFEAAVGGLADPLNDPLPEQQPGAGAGGGTGAGPGSPWFRDDAAGHEQQAPVPGPGPVRASVPKHAAPASAPAPVPPAEPVPVPVAAQDPVSEWSDDYYNQYVSEEPQPDLEAISAPAPADPVPAAPVPVRQPDPVPRLDDETVALRTADVPALAEPRPEPPAAGGATGGRAERRKAAKGGSRARKGPEAASSSLQDGSGAPAKPLSRVEARRAARALKDSPGVVISRVVGELFISFGVLMLLFVTYQLWWTNIRADQYAGNETNKIQDNWAHGSGSKNPQAGAFAPGQGFAIMHIPKLDVVVPIAEGTSKAKVLDHGMVGHYSEGSLKTAMPSDKQGNFAVAGHRNTHGEPFRYINQLKPGDEVVVETQDTYYTYDMTRTLPSTSPSNVSVIDPVPVGSGFTKPGRYITLTTCTPEFTSTYRLIVWGKMVDEQPRSQGLPKALQG